MPILTASQRKFLRSEAHHLDAVVIIGKAGATDAIVGAIDGALEAHELIKVRFNDFKDQKVALLEDIQLRTRCERCGLVGHVAVLYRQHPESDKRKITLPR